MKKLTIEDIRNFGPCYDPTRFLPEAWQGTILDILDMKEVPFQDRVWTIMRTEFVSEKLMRLFACFCARQCQPNNKDDRIEFAISVMERFAVGEATEADRGAAESAARSAARSAASAAWSAAWSAAESAARSAAESAARSAARSAASAARSAASAAWSAAESAARSAARSAASAARSAAESAQEQKLRKMIIKGQETGDVF